MENELILELARDACRRIDGGDPCKGHPCDGCIRTARGNYEARISNDDRLRARIKALEVMLLEVLEIAVQHEEGDYVRRAQDVLFDTQPTLKLVKGAPSV